jgi:dihydrofolate reductase
MRCSVFIATSLDGFIARPDGSLDWLTGHDHQGNDYGYAAFAASVDALVIGRATYEIARGFDAWPYAGKRVVVLTHRGGEPRHGEELVAESAAAVAARLARDGCRRAYVDGGAVIRQFVSAGLIDDLTISVIPRLLGAGLPLWGDTRDTRLRLTACESWPTGVVQVRYERITGA